MEHHIKAVWSDNEDGTVLAGWPTEKEGKDE